MDMEFKNSFVAGAAAGTASNASANATNNLKTTADNGQEKSFESTLNSKKNELNESKNVDKAEKTETKQKDTVKKNAGEKPAANERTEKPEIAEKAEAMKAKDPIADKIKEVVAEEPMAAPELTPEQSAEVIQQIAEALNVTPEQVTQALETLEMQPTDLLNNKEAMSKFIMEVKGVTDPVEMLKMPDLTKMMKEVNQLLEAAVEQAQTAVSTPENTAIQTAQTVPAEALATQTAESAMEETPEMTQMTAENLGGVSEDAKADVEAAETQETQTETETEITPAQASPQMSQNGQEQGTGMGNSNEQPSDTPQAGEGEESQITPVVVRHGDETVVEIGGRTVSRTAARPPVQAGDVIDQIVEKFKIDFKGDSTEIKINLRPNDLGNVSVRLVSESGLVTAEIVAENSKVKELIEENIDALKESLKKQGVNVGELSVSVGQQEADDKMRQFMREQQKTRTRINQIINRITDEEIELSPEENFADEAAVSGNSVDFTA